MLLKKFKTVKVNSAKLFSLSILYPEAVPVSHTHTNQSFCYTCMHACICP